MADNSSLYPNVEHVKDGVLKRGARAVGSAGWSAAKATGKAAGKAGWWFGKKLGKGAYHAGKVAAGAAFTAGKFGAKAGVTGGVLAAKGLEKPVGTAAHGAGKLLGNMVKYNPERRVFNETTGKLMTKGGNFRLTKLGMGVVLGIGLLGGASKGVDTYEADRIGTPSNGITTNTPDYNPVDYQTSIPDDMGATGDLVFALHANR